MSSKTFSITDTQFSVEWATSARCITEITGFLHVVCIKESSGSAGHLIEKLGINLQ